jgi:release factor glutamine methyltransferase
MTNNMSLSDALKDASVALWAVSETPRLDAELLAAFGLGMSRNDMLMQMRDLSAPAGYDQLLMRRIAHEPVAYITGVQAFWNIDLNVNPAVLIPRSDSETLIEAAQHAFAGTNGPARILDLGTGSGALLLAALSLFSNASGIGIDASVAAVDVARHNAERLGMSARSDIQLRSWKDDNWAAGLGTFDLVLCNPPYVETTAKLSQMVSDYEPHSALFSGEDGMDDYAILLPQISGLLSHGGAAIFEIGYTQAKAVSMLASKGGLESELRLDLAGNPRCLTLHAR